ncbi:MAG: sodium ion-translocating decarboxylase subunit beta [Lachnospiraceae bacterium]|nr:sodium ion-translocating decarboxylase subunit beta [Lachnospiraceae bacterium]
MKKGTYAVIAAALIVAGCGIQEEGVEIIGGADGPTSIFLAGETDGSEAGPAETESEERGSEAVPAETETETGGSEAEPAETESETDGSEERPVIKGTWVTASMGYEYYGTTQPEYYVQFTESEIHYLHQKDDELILDHSDPIVRIEEIGDGRYKIQAQRENGGQYTYQTAESDDHMLNYYWTWAEKEFSEKYSAGASLTYCSGSEGDEKED